MYERQIMNVIEKSIIGKKCQEACEDGLVVTDDFIAVIDGSTSKTPKHLNPEMKNGRYAMMLISQYIQHELKADATVDDFCQGITHYICDKVYKPLGVAELHCTSSDSTFRTQRCVFSYCWQLRQDSIEDNDYQLLS